jgi:hypothetical protein
MKPLEWPKLTNWQKLGYLFLFFEVRKALPNDSRRLLDIAGASVVWYHFKKKREAERNATPTPAPALAANYYSQPAPKTVPRSSVSPAPAAPAPAPRYSREQVAAYYENLVREYRRSKKGK